MNDATEVGALRDRVFHRILIIKPSSLGDVIHALPVLHGLRERYPKAAISWLIGKPFAPLIERHPELDDVILFDRARYSRFGRSIRATTAFVDFARVLRRRDFDLVIDLQGLFRSGLLAFVTGAAVRIGFASARELAWAFYNHRLRTPDPNLHAADKNYLVSRVLGFDAVAMRFDLAVTEDERTRAKEILSTAGLGSTDRFVSVWPGARWETKRWAAQRFAETIGRLHREHDLRAVLMGDPNERELCTRIAAESGVSPIVLAGATGIREAVAVTERSAVVVAHDSAPVHIAAALGRPLVAVCGPTNPARTGPYAARDSVIQADLPCVPCYLKRLACCPYDHQCMKDVTVDIVVRAVRAAERGVGREAERTGGAPREI